MSTAPVTPTVVARPFRATARLALAYLLLSLCWVFSNPGAAAPDEPDHLVKALGNASFQLGERPPGTGEDLPWLLQRNFSTTRVYEIPARLAPDGTTCFAFAPTTTAACQTQAMPDLRRATGDVPYSAAVGDYPAFLYVPIGAVASLAQTPYQAFVLGRLVVALMSVGILWLGMAQLARWLGRRSAVAYAVALSPVAVFVMSSVSSSGIELASAVSVAAVVTTCVLRPDVVHRPSTHWTFLVAASGLALSRQLGVLALAVFCVVLLCAVGWQRVLTLLRSRQPSFLAAVVVVGVATGAALWWERSYDHPAHVLSPFDAKAVAAFLDIAAPTLSSTVGTFGWLDTYLPTPATGAWLALWAIAIGAAGLLAARRVAVILVAMLGIVLALAVAIYAGAFYPIGASIQGRHFLPILSLALVLSTAALTQGAVLGRSSSRRLFVSIAVVVPLVQFVSLYTNGRRYAVGSDGPWWWIPDAQWSPAGGWTLWLLVSLVAAAWLAVEILLLHRGDDTPESAGSPQVGEVEPSRV